MNKYRYLRAGAAVIIGILSVSAFAGLFYPLKIFDFQLTALLQRVLVDFSLFFSDEYIVPYFARSVCIRNF